MRTIDEAWRKDQVTYNYIGKTRWTAFTNFYTKNIKELQDDGMDHNGTAHLKERQFEYNMPSTEQNNIIQIEDNGDSIAPEYHY
jgi:hypothetical protein